MFVDVHNGLMLVFVVKCNAIVFELKLRVYHTNLVSHFEVPEEFVLFLLTYAIVASAFKHVDFILRMYWIKNHLVSIN